MAACRRASTVRCSSSFLGPPPLVRARACSRADMSACSDCSPSIDTDSGPFPCSNAAIYWSKDSATEPWDTNDAILPLTHLGWLYLPKFTPASVTGATTRSAYSDGLHARTTQLSSSRSKQCNQV